MLKHKKILVCSALLLTIGVGSTLAYLQQRSNDLTNTFEVANVETEIDEPKMEQDNSDLKKTPSVKNTGKTDVIIRVRCVVSPEDVLDGKIDYNTDLNSITAKDSDVEGNWVNGNDGYWYYQAVIPANKETEPLFTTISNVFVKNDDGTYSFAEGCEDFDITIYQESVQANINLNDGSSLSAIDKDGKYNQTNADQIWDIFEKNQN